MYARLFLATSLALVIASAGCGLLASGPKLRGAVYANQVPVYPSATPDGMMGGTYSGSVGGPAVSQTQSWFFKIEDPVDKVVAFYEKKLAGATKEVDDGEVTFTLAPTGGAKGEELTVRIEPGRLQITEEVLPGKIKDDDLF